MSFYETAYDTTAGKIYSDLKKLDHAIREALVGGEAANRNLGVERHMQYNAAFVTGIGIEETKVPPFTHPYLIQNFRGEHYIVTDVRFFKGNATNDWISEREFEAAIRNKAEYALAKSRAAINLLWLSEAPSRLLSQFRFAGTVFASWLSQAISRTYALDPQDQARMTAVGIYFYHTLFTPDVRLTDTQLETAVVHTINATKLPAKDVYTQFEAIGEMRTIEDYCFEIKRCVENVRLQSFNLAMLLTLVQNSWYATNSTEIISVALEHPPTWISMLYAVMTERGYKASPLFRLVEMHAKRGNGDEFLLNYRKLYSDNVLVLETIGEELVVRDFGG